MEKNGNESKPEEVKMDVTHKEGDGNTKSASNSSESRTGGGSYMGTSNRSGRPHSSKPKGGGRRYPRKSFEKESCRQETG